MKQPILIGTTSYTVLVFIPDPASTDGSGKTGLVAADLTASYTRVETDNDVVVTDVTSALNNLAALTSNHTDWGWLEVSNTLAPGLYRFDIANAAFASGAWTVVVYVMITTSVAAPSPMEFRLVAYNELDGVRLGLTALPNAAAGANTGLPVVGTQVPNATAGAANGLLIAGSNAATTFATLTSTGAVAFQSTFAVTTSTALGALSCTTLTASGAVALQSTLAITGAVTLSSTLGVGATTLSSLTVTNNLLVSGTATITGATTFTGAITGTNAANDLRGILTQKTISAAMDELGSVPAAGPSAGAALEFIFMALRNKRQTTASTDIITNDAGGTIATGALSDDTITFEKGEYA